MSAGRSDEDDAPSKDATQDRPRIFVEPRLPRWPWLGLTVWAALPAILVFVSRGLDAMSGPWWLGTAADATRWAGFYGGPVILYAWSCHVLRSRREPWWYLKALPLTVSMVVVNATIVFGGRLGGRPGGMGAGGM
ncbi:MAG: hypothetical protein ACF8PN_02125 [Phycisphaerales bacterium]